MFSPLLACLALGIGLNASILTSSEVKGISMSNTINEINVQQCEMGSYKTKKTPSASPEVHGTSSIPCKGGNYPTNASLWLQESTLRGGMKLLETVRPVWTKVTESEQRLSWMKSMIDKKLIVRDLDAYAKRIGLQLRSEEYLFKEEEREILMGVMNLKLKDERRNLTALKRKKEDMRHEILKCLGRGNKLDNTMSRLRKEMIKLKSKLKRKYQAKIEHLMKIRKQEIEEKRKLKKIPEEISVFKDCAIFDDEKWKLFKTQNLEGVVVGKISLDADERSVLRLSPKFAVLSRLDDDSIERDIEVGVTKMKYEIKRYEDQKLLDSVELDNSNKRLKLERNDDYEKDNELNEAKERQIFDPVNLIFDFSKRRATDCPENTKVFLPQMVGPKEETSLKC